MRRTTAQTPSQAPDIPTPQQAAPKVAHRGQDGSREGLPTPAGVYPKRKAGAKAGRLTNEQKLHEPAYTRNIEDPDAKKNRAKAAARTTAPTIRYHIPSVAKHVARVVIMHSMDYIRAVEYILGARAEDAQVYKIAASIEADPGVQKLIEAELTVNGLDDASKEAFLHEMWEWLRLGNDNLKIKAAGILGRGFVAEKVETTKPEELPIAGLGDMARSMLGEKGGTLDDVQLKESASGDERGPVLDAARPKPPKD